MTNYVTIDKQKKSELGDLLDKYSEAYGRISEVIQLIYELTGHNIDLPKINWTIAGVMNQLDILNETVKKVFQVCTEPEQDTEKEAA